jgi:YceI-like domain
MYCRKLAALNRKSDRNGIHACLVADSNARWRAINGTLTGSSVARVACAPVTLVKHFAPDPLTKKDTLGFSAQGDFSRARFGLSTWFPAVGDDVNVRIQAEFVRRSAAPGRAADVPDVSFRRGIDGAVQDQLAAFA